MDTIDPDFPEQPPDPACHVARGLARAFLHTGGEAMDLQQRAIAALARDWPWLPKLVRKLVLTFSLPLQARDFDRIVAWILNQPAFINAFTNNEKPRLVRYFSVHPQMEAPPPALAACDLPVLHTARDLASWLALSIEELDWLADPGGWRGRSEIEPRRHYRYLWKAKASGNWRLIESPKPLLRGIQRKILHGLLDKLPVHAAAHGCVKGRSILSNAKEHLGAPLLIKLDLCDFFPSISAARVHATFRTLGYPLVVARYLTALTTHATPAFALRDNPDAESQNSERRRVSRNQIEVYCQRHLPQGAPSSPALANLCAWRLDLRLAAAAQESGARYTRYVDDLVFSCPVHTGEHARRIALMAATITLEEGFTPHPQKTRIITQAQAQWVTGVLVNIRPNIGRRDFDTLKAILTNCRHHGPSSQNRTSHPDFRAHLQGRIAHLRHLHPERGTKLQALFDAINWDA